MVVYRLHQLFRVWLVTAHGQTHSRDFWNRAEAEKAARELAASSGGRIFWHQSDGEWAEIPN